MKHPSIIKASVFLLILCLGAGQANSQGAYAPDSLILLSMVQMRQFAMKKKDIPAIMKQYADDGTLVNPAGYFYANKKEIEQYYNTLNHLDTITYNYSWGAVELRMLDGENALIYYPWEMDWYNTKNPGNILYKEFGLMSISAQKRNTIWYWVAVNDQHTTDFFEDLYQHKGVTPEKKGGVSAQGN